MPKETQTPEASQQKSVIVTQKPYRNSVVISTNKVENNEVVPEKQSDDSTVFNFLKSIIKFG